MVSASHIFEILRLMPQNDVVGQALWREYETTNRLIPASAKVPPLLICLVGLRGRSPVEGPADQLNIPELRSR